MKGRCHGGMLSAHRQDSFNNNSNALGQMTAATGQNKTNLVTNGMVWYGMVLSEYQNICYKVCIMSTRMPDSRKEFTNKWVF